MANKEEVDNSTQAVQSTTYDKPFEMKEGQIMIFKNLRKEDSKQPDYWGKAIIDGVEKRIGMWLNESASGTKYFNGNIRDYVPNSATEEESDESVPF